MFNENKSFIKPNELTISSWKDFSHLQSDTSFNFGNPSRVGPDQGRAAEKRGLSVRWFGAAQGFCQPQQVI